MVLPKQGPFRAKPAKNRQFIPILPGVELLGTEPTNFAKNARKETVLPTEVSK